MAERTSIDPLTLSLIEGRLNSMNEEMGDRVFRQAFSMVTAHIHDLGTVLFDNKERTVTIGNWMPVHTAGSDVSLKGVLDWIGRDNIHPDDFIIANDPFIVRFGHAPDWSFVRAIFYEDELLFYAYLRTHQYDSGGAFQGCYYPRTYDCHGEGLMIPPVKVIERGVIDEKVLSVIHRNVRGRAMVRADNMLVFEAMKKAEARVLDLLRSYGKETVLAGIDELLRRTEESVRKVISTWPAGTYRAERAADWDGTTDKPVWVRLALTVKPKEGQLIFDFSDSDPQVDYINCPRGQTCAAVVSGVAWSLPAGTARNQGLLDCLRIITKEGSVLGPTYPATTGAQSVTMGTQVTECVQIALSQVVPKETSAVWSRHLSPIVTGKRRDKVDPRTNSPQVYWTSPFHSDGSSGAMYGYDGVDGLGPCHAGGGVVRAPVEVEEWDTTYRWLLYEFLKDSMGDGQWRGGAATQVRLQNVYDRKAWQPLDCVVMTGNSDGEKFTHTGLLGGTDGKVNELGIIRKGRGVQLRCCDVQYLQPGDIIWTRGGGAGGWGDPLDRDPEKVRLDVLNDYISMQRAKDVYGVVMKGKEFVVDEKATQELRTKLKAQKAKGTKAKGQLKAQKSKSGKTKKPLKVQKAKSARVKSGKTKRKA
jgi:N-methylhydantoinase B